MLYSYIDAIALLELNGIRISDACAGRKRNLRTEPFQGRHFLWRMKPFFDYWETNGFLGNGRD
jgi:hypothetical protein